VIEDDDPDQHEDASREGEEDELDRRIHPVGTAPDADEQKHRDQHELPEDEKEKQVEGDKDADHRGLHDQQCEEELLHPGVDRPPGHAHAEHAEQCREHHEEHADAVDADRVLDAPDGDPRVALDKLHVVGALVEFGEERQREDQGRDCCRQTRPPDETLPPQEQQRQTPEHRQKDDDREDRVPDVGGKSGFHRHHPHNRTSPVTINPRAPRQRTIA